MRRIAWTRKKGRPEESFAEKSKYFRHPGCQCYSKHEARPPTACDSLVYKDYKTNLDFLFITSVINSEGSGPKTSTFLLSTMISPSITVFFQRLSQTSFLIAFSESFWSSNFSSTTCCFQSSFRHPLQILDPFPKMIFLYFFCLSTIDFSSSCLVFIQFPRDMCNSLASSNNFFLLIYFFCNPFVGYKTLFLSNCSMLHCVKCVNIRSIFWSVFSRIRTECGKIQTRKNSVFGYFSCSVEYTAHVFISPFTPQNIHHCHVNHLTC